MSIINSVQPPAQQQSTGGISQNHAKHNKEIAKRDVQTIAGTAIGGLGVLCLIAWLLLPLSTNIVPFVAAGAVPLFTLIVIVYQAVVYRRQWYAMQDALSQAAQQTEIASTDLRVSQQSYVGIQDIKWQEPDLGEDLELTNPRALVVEIGNVGNVPADHIKVFIEIMVYIPGISLGMPATTVDRRVPHHEEYGTTQLFKGNLPIRIRLPLVRHKIKEDWIDLIYEEKGGFIALHGEILYTDGFGKKKTPFMFGYMGGDVWTPTAPELWEYRTKRKWQDEETESKTK